METLEAAPETLTDTPQPNNRQQPPSLSNWMSGLGKLEETTDDAGKPTVAVVGAKTDEQEANEKAAAAATKPVETTTAKPAESEGEKWPRTAKDWDSFKASRKAKEEALAAEAKAAREERDRIKTELEEARKATPATPADYEDNKKRLDEAERILKTVAVEKHPKFQSYFGSKFDSQYGMAKSIVGSEHAAQIEKILKISDPDVRDRQFEDFTGTLSTLQQSRLAAVLNNITSIEQEKSQAIADAGKSYEEMTAAEKTRVQTETRARQDAYTKAFDAQIAAAQDAAKGLPVFQKNNDPEWNKQVDALVESSKTILMSGRNMSPEDAARAAMYAASFPGLLKWANTEISAKDAKIATLTKQVQDLTGAEPALRGGERPAGGGNDTPARIERKAHASPADATAAWTKQITQDWRKS